MLPLQPPPRDLSGKISRHNHPEILDEDTIIRRISPHHLVPDGQGRSVISSMAYQESSEDGEGMSIDIEKLILEDGKNPSDVLISSDWIGAVQFDAGFLRSKELDVGYDPIEEGVNINPYHGQIWGKFPKSVKRALQKAAEWYIEAEGVLLRR